MIIITIIHIRITVRGFGTRRAPWPPRLAPTGLSSDLGRLESLNGPLDRAPRGTLVAGDRSERRFGTILASPGGASIPRNRAPV